MGRVRWDGIGVGFGVRVGRVGVGCRVVLSGVGRGGVARVWG